MIKQHLVDHLVGLGHTEASAREALEPTAILVTIGHWGIPVAVKHCLCPDGRRRRARLTGDADTFYSVPASVKVYVEGEDRKVAVTVSGYVTGREGPGGEQDYEFRPVAGRKHSGVFGA
jgi:hypothetical protein